MGLLFRIRKREGSKTSYNFQSLKTKNEGNNALLLPYFFNFTSSKRTKKGIGEHKKPYFGE
jgi:hypothetical protein